ncbi:MAG: ricin-type beta-trefoil lectin domain protein [Methylococcales bacterium]
MRRLLVVIFFFTLFANTVIAAECGIKLGGGGKDSSWIKLKNDRVTSANDIGGPWSFIRETYGPCDFRMYNKGNYKGKYVHYGSGIVERLRVGAIGGSDKDGWKVRSVVITPRSTQCSIELNESDHEFQLRSGSTRIYTHKQVFYGPARISNITGWSSVAAISGDSNCQYKLYNGSTFDRQFINLEKVSSPYRIGWRIRSIEIINNAGGTRRTPPSRLRTRPIPPRSSKQNYSEIRHIKGRCLDIAGGINRNKTNIQIYACNGSKSQKWHWTKNKEIKNIMGLCLDVSGGVNADHTNIQLYQCNGSKSQQWRIISNKRIQNVMGRCLDIVNGIDANKTNVQLYRCKNVDAQQWR